ncbi:hypothetical protein [Shimwellia blattae]|uniref:Uncharacterized protein n=1 Tax=Shimwellia blattae (strain ATCC 29907 / DSM 4481 / JCM 1650 / NBRC 105725 / CDC 9005-74) TaxID=630626 RepID=I2B9E4_SHIBC|nr:hypothetical protein [Shimwellia blattae]AFJ47148.1 hypothetical protein EBL_c20570 [Shimwellia blattae DSM 4481 = NBRC 105725]GAB80732.1 hypothetical protein EB105725_08_00170 [Shimwellia blattae DSM 4481 = NBRC 105725]VDY64640.1 Uncharacterised protein [Shimwellia blattae]VEC22747.1 Uncharacterised protein [Shimwellia blattae]
MKTSPKSAPNTDIPLPAEGNNDLIPVRAQRRFLDGDNYRGLDDAFSVSRQRAAELAANGLIVPEEWGPENKMKSVPVNKAGEP